MRSPRLRNGERGVEARTTFRWRSHAVLRDCRGRGPRRILGLQMRGSIMLTRRRLLSGAALAGLAALAGARRGSAFTLEPMPGPVKSIYALACKSPSLGDHALLIADAQ